MKLKSNLKNYLTKYYRILFALMVLSILFLNSCKHTSQTLSKAEMKAIVEKQNAVLESCFLEGNADILAEMYTDSAKLSPNGYGFVSGRDNIKAFWLEDFKSSKVLKMETIVLTIDGNENLIYETGNTFSDILYNDSVYHARVKYINVWCKQPNGIYKLDVDFWNKDAQLSE
jgi:ketosteroid isomerase-like protein